MAANFSHNLREASNDLNTNHGSTSPSPVHIVIVGAGVAGLTCARRLSQLLKTRSHRITVLEARDRVGGRTYSIPDLNLDLGASWIFSHHSQVKSLARELHISPCEQYESGTSLLDTPSGRIERGIIHGIHSDAKRLKGGTGSLCTAMLSELTAPKNTTVSVQLNSPVRKVTLNDNGTIHVVINDHRFIVADYIIFSLPPRLFMASIELTPALPQSLTRELAECGTWMGSTCKAILVYDRPWWKDQKLSGFAMSRQSKAQEWHDASSESCNALFTFCLSGTTKEEVIDATVRMFGHDARSPTSVYITDWGNEVFTSSSVTDGRGGHPHLSSTSRKAHWNNRLWLGNSEVSDMDAGFVEGGVRRGTEVADQLGLLLL